MTFVKCLNLKNRKLNGLGSLKDGVSFSKMSAFSIGGVPDGIGPSSFSFNANKLQGYNVLSQISKCVTLAPLPSDFNGFWFPLRVIRISGFVGAVKGAFPVK